jgi:DNA-binding response OmpR family regulator
MNRIASNDHGPPDDVTTGSSRWIQCAGMAIWPGRRLVKIGHRTVILTNTEMAILMALVRADGEPVARDALADLCGRRHRLTKKSRTVDTMIFSLRKKLGDTGKPSRIIVTVPSFGYAIDTDVDWGL